MGRDVGNSQVSGSEIVQESLSAQRTIASLCLEEHFYEVFYSRVMGDQK